MAKTNPLCMSRNLDVTIEHETEHLYQPFIRSLDSMTHVFLDMEAKEEAKAFFGITSVPYYVVVDQVRVIE